MHYCRCTNRAPHVGELPQHELGGGTKIFTNPRRNMCNVAPHSVELNPLLSIHYSLAYAELCIGLVPTTHILQDQKISFPCIQSLRVEVTDCLVEALTSVPRLHLSTLIVLLDPELVLFQIR